MAAIAAAVAALLLLQPRVGPALLHVTIAAVPHQPYCKNLRGGYQEVR